MAVTISISDELYQKIVILKNHPDESGEEIITEFLKGRIDPGPISEETLNRVDQVREDFKKGRCQTLQEVMDEFGDTFE